MDEFIIVFKIIFTLKYSVINKMKYTKQTYYLYVPEQRNPVAFIEEII